MVSRSLQRLEEKLNVDVKAVGADRGFDSESNRQWFKEQKTYNGICLRSPEELKQRKKSWKFSRDCSGDAVNAKDALAW